LKSCMNSPSFSLLRLAHGFLQW